MHINLTSVFFIFHFQSQLIIPFFYKFSWVHLCGILVTGFSRHGDAISEPDDECLEETSHTPCTRYFSCSSSRTRKAALWKGHGGWWCCKVQSSIMFWVCQYIFLKLALLVKGERDRDSYNVYLSSYLLLRKKADDEININWKYT